MVEGLVKARNLKKRYFVVEGESGDTYFVPAKSVYTGQRIRVGDRVSFDENPDESRGKKGKNLRHSDYA